MNVLIVYAHPEPKSMNHAMLDAMRERFARHGWRVAVSDLYANRSRAVPSPLDFTALRNPEHFSLAHEQRHAQRGRLYRTDILCQQDKVAWADLVVFQFPLWWYAVPAVLKGWAERVLTKGFAYDDEHMFEHGLLKGKRTMLSLTTGATRAELDADSRHTGSVEQFLQPFAGGVLGFCGFALLDPFIAYAVGPMSMSERSQVLDALRARVDRIVLDAAPLPAALRTTSTTSTTPTMFSPTIERTTS